MNTSVLAAGLLGSAAATLSLGGCLTAPLAQPPPVPAELRGGGRVTISSGYLTRAGKPAVVAGQLRRDPLWSGPIRGHLHVMAFGADDKVLAGRAVRWVRPIGRQQHWTASYRVGLRIRRSAIARIAVSYAADDHKMSEDFR